MKLNMHTPETRRQRLEQATYDDFDTFDTFEAIYTQAEMERVVAYVISVHTGRNPDTPMKREHVQEMIKRGLRS